MVLIHDMDNSTSPSLLIPLKKQASKGSLQFRLFKLPLTLPLLIGMLHFIGPVSQSSMTSLRCSLGLMTTNFINIFMEIQLPSFLFWQWDRLQRLLLTPFQRFLPFPYLQPPSLAELTKCYFVLHIIGANTSREWRLVRIAFNNSVALYPSCTLDG